MTNNKKITGLSPSVIFGLKVMPFKTFRVGDAIDVLAGNGCVFDVSIDNGKTIKDATLVSFSKQGDKEMVGDDTIQAYIDEKSKTANIVDVLNEITLIDKGDFKEIVPDVDGLRALVISGDSRKDYGFNRIKISNIRCKI